MPKETPTGTYAGIPRFNAGQRIFAYGYNLGNGGYKNLSRCMSVEINGASFMTASAIAMGALTAVLI